MAECDFCGSKNVVRRFPCRDFESASEAVGVTYNTPVAADTNLILASKSYWAACSACARLVDAKDIEGLVNRALRILATKDRFTAKTVELLRAHLLWTYGLFFQNRLPDTND